MGKVRTKERESSKGRFLNKSIGPFLLAAALSFKIQCFKAKEMREKSKGTKIFSKKIPWKEFESSKMVVVTFSLAALALMAGNVNGESFQEISLYKFIFLTSSVNIDKFSGCQQGWEDAGNNGGCFKYEQRSGNEYVHSRNS